MEPTHVRLTIPDSIDPTELMGPADALLRRVEGAFDAMVAVRGNHISLAGDPAEVELATSVFSRMIRLAIGPSPVFQCFGGDPRSVSTTQPSRS